MSFLKNIVEPVEHSLKKQVTVNDEIDYEILPFTVSSFKYITSYNEGKLLKWISELKVSLHSLLQIENNNSTNPSTNQSFAKGIIQKVNVTYDPNDRQITVFIYIPKTLEDKNIDFDEDDYNTFRKEENVKFKSVFNSTADYSDHDTLLNGYEKHIYTALKTNNFVMFSDAVLLLEGIVDLANEKTSDIFYKLSKINHSVYNLLNDFERTKFTSNTFLNYWKTYFTATTKFLPKEKDFVRYSLDDLASAIQNKILTKNDIASLDRFFTNFFQFQKLNPKLVYHLTNGLIGVSLSLFRKKKFTISLKILEFITFIRDDLSKNKSYISKKYSSEDLLKMVSTAEQGLIMASAYYLSFIKRDDPDQEEFLQSIFKLISKKTILKTIQDLESHNNEEKWDIFNWRVHKFDRHGTGGSWSHSHFMFLKNFITAYFKSNPNLGYLFDNLEIKESSSHFFKELEKDFTSSPELAAILPSLQNANYRITEKLNNEIIISKLSPTKINELIFATFSGYEKQFKFSDLIKSKSIINEIATTDSMGVYTLLPKKWINEKSDVDVDKFDEYGTAVGKGENLAIHELIQEISPARNVSIKHFYKKYLPILLQLSTRNNNELVFLGKSYELNTKHFNWHDRKCKFNNNIEISYESLNERNTNYVDIIFNNKIIRINKISADTKNNFFYFFKADSIDLRFYKYGEKITSSNIDNEPKSLAIVTEGQNNLYTEVQEINEKIAEEFLRKNPDMVEGNSRSDKNRNLRMNVTLKVFSTPKVENLKNVKSFEINLGDLDLDEN